MNPNRIRVLNEDESKPGPVLYWMSRDQRVNDNWALLHAREMARQRTSALVVAFCLVDDCLGANYRSFAFMLHGLAEVAEHLRILGIPFHLLQGAPGEQLPRLVQRLGVGVLVADMDPLRPKREWLQQVVERLDIPCYQVDAHNVVPVWIASPKLEYAARTIRPKLLRLLPEYLEPFPELTPQQSPETPWPEKPDWDQLLARFHKPSSQPELNWLEPGEHAASECMRLFIENKLATYDQRRNDPNLDGQSDLSPYLHFGQLAAQRLAWEVDSASVPTEAKGAFLEELIVRRELSDNHCWYNAQYGTFAGLPAWAQRTLDAHRTDLRPYLYSCDELEQGRTHDTLWNAAQRELVCRSKMHGYMRMYWAKKILEWSPSPEKALEAALTLNDRYSLDGRDPNGYVGVAWAIGGLHDRPWATRPVFGQIRYMNEAGCRRKFDVAAYISRCEKL
ncbi:MAG: deoxyribodipyrimidine photo-lyase [Anaerolineae bacterium]